VTDIWASLTVIYKSCAEKLNDLIVFSGARNYTRSHDDISRLHELSPRIRP